MIPNRADPDLTVKSGVDAGDAGEVRPPDDQRNVDTSAVTSAVSHRDGETHIDEGQVTAKRDIKKVPSNFGRYRIEKELGRGGMGAVYLARDHAVGSQVAIKIPFFSEDEEADSVERFHREARTMATVQHSNLCPVYDVGQFELWHFLTMPISMASRCR